MTITTEHLMPAETDQHTTDSVSTEPATGEEVNAMFSFNRRPRPDNGSVGRQRAELDRAVVLESLRQQRRAQQQQRAVHARLWGVRANR